MNNIAFVVQTVVRENSREDVFDYMQDRIEKSISCHLSSFIRDTVFLSPANVMADLHVVVINGCGNVYEANIRTNNNR